MRYIAITLAAALMMSTAALAAEPDSLTIYAEGHPLAKGRAYMAKGKYGDAADFYHSASARFEGTAIGLEASYMEAESRRLAGRYHAAIKSYRRLQREYPFSPKAEEAQYQIAWCYSQRKGIRSALYTVSAVDLLLSSFPESRFRDQALAMKEEAQGRQGNTVKNKAATPEAVFGRAKEYFDRGKYIDAMEGFKDVIYNHPGTRLAAEATYLLGECYFRTKDYEAAVDEYAQILQDYPSSPNADDAQYMIACSYFKQSPHYALDQKETGEKAKASVDRFYERFPDSPLMPEVKKLQGRIDEKLARKEYEAGKIYYKMNNHQSAKIYFNYVLEQYPETAWADKSREYLARLERETPTQKKNVTGYQGAPPPTDN